MSEYSTFMALSKLGPQPTELPMNVHAGIDFSSTVTWELPEYPETSELYLNAGLLGDVAYCLGTSAVRVSSYRDESNPQPELVEQADVRVGQLPHPDHPLRSRLIEVSLGEASILQAVGKALEDSELSLADAFADVIDDGLRVGLTELGHRQLYGPKPAQLARLLRGTPLITTRVDLEMAKFKL